MLLFANARGDGTLVTVKCPAPGTHRKTNARGLLGRGMLAVGIDSNITLTNPLRPYKDQSFPSNPAGSLDAENLIDRALHSIPKSRSHYTCSIKYISIQSAKKPLETNYYFKSMNIYPLKFKKMWTSRFLEVLKVKNRACPDKIGKIVRYGNRNPTCACLSYFSSAIAFLKK